MVHRFPVRDDVSVDGRRFARHFCRFPGGGVRRFGGRFVGSDLERFRGEDRGFRGQRGGWFSQKHSVKFDFSQPVDSRPCSPSSGLKSSVTWLRHDVDRRDARADPLLQEEVPEAFTEVSVNQRRFGTVLIRELVPHFTRSRFFVAEPFSPCSISAPSSVKVRISPAVAVLRVWHCFPRLAARKGVDSLGGLPSGDRPGSGAGFACRDGFDRRGFANCPRMWRRSRFQVPPIRRSRSAAALPGRCSLR